MLEIDIDVGRLVARGANEALEQDVDAGRVDRRDAEAVTDDRIGGRAAPLAQDAALPCETHDVVDGQEIAGVVEPLDQLQLVLDQMADLVRNTSSFVIPAKAGIQGSRVRTVALDHRFSGGDGRAKALSSALPRKFFEVLLWRTAVRDHLLGVFIAQFVEAEVAAFDDFEAALDRILTAAKQPRHLLRPFQMALGIGGEAIAGLPDRASFADTGQHVLQRAPLGQMVEHVVDRDERQPNRFAESSEAGETPHIVAAIEMVHGEIGAAPEVHRDAGRGVGGQDHHNLTLAMRDDVGVVEMALALGGAALAERQ